MANQGFLKSTEADQADQLDNFAIKIPVYAPALGVTPAETASAASDAAYFRWLLNISNMISAYNQSVTQYKSIIKKSAPGALIGIFPPMPVLPPPPPAVAGGVLDRFTNLGKRIKLNANYTTSIGEDLQIIADATAVDLSTVKPALTLKSSPSGRNIEFNLKGIFDGVNIYKLSAGDAGFHFAGRDVSSPFTDTTPSPTGTRYKAFYVKGDQEVGLASDEAVVD